MKRNTQANDGKILRYSLRKYKLGLASVTIGAIFLSFLLFKSSRQMKQYQRPNQAHR